MKTVDYLDRWLAAGSITGAQHSAISGIVRRERMSVFVELNALLYFGVLAFAGGLAWTARVYAHRWGDAAILVPATAILAASLFYCISRVSPYSPVKVETPSFVFDYILYLACLVFAAELGYVEYRFELLRAQWDDYLLGSSVLFFAAAYRFDNRFVLSLAIATLGGWFGVRLFSLGVFGTATLPVSALTYGLIVAALGVWLYRVSIKQHFLNTYLHVATNVVLGALVAGAAQGSARSLWLAGLIVGAVAVVAAGICFRRFAFVVYGVGYGYIGVSGEWLPVRRRRRTRPGRGRAAGVFQSVQFLEAPAGCRHLWYRARCSECDASAVWDLMLLGALLVGVAIGVRRWLTGGLAGARAGYTAVQLLESESRAIQVAGMASATMHPGPIGESSSPANTQFSDGRSGGAGAGAEF